MHQSDLQSLPVPTGPAPHHLPQEQSHAPRGHVAEAARDPEEEEAGLHGAGGTTGHLRGLRGPGAVPGHCRRRCGEQDRKRLGGGSAGNSFPRRAGLCGVGPAWGGELEGCQRVGSATPAPCTTPGVVTPRTIPSWGGAKGP